MADPRDYKLEISSLPDAAGDPRPVRRPFLSVHFACCGVYQRIYRQANDDTYTGRCPRCGQTVRFAVGPGGTTCRCFVVE